MPRTGLDIYIFSGYQKKAVKNFLAYSTSFEFSLAPLLPAIPISNGDEDAEDDDADSDTDIPRCGDIGVSASGSAGLGSVESAPRFLRLVVAVLRIEADRVSSPTEEN